MLARQQSSIASTKYFSLSVYLSVPLSFFLPKHSPCLCLFAISRSLCSSLAFLPRPLRPPRAPFNRPVCLSTSLTVHLCLWLVAELCCGNEGGLGRAALFFGCFNLCLSFAHRHNSHGCLIDIVFASSENAMDRPSLSIPLVYTCCRCNIGTDVGSVSLAIGVSAR